MLSHNLHLLCELLIELPLYLVHSTSDDNTFLCHFNLTQVSTVYNQIVSKNNADLIVNSVIILFVMEIDERVFSTLAAFNGKWTTHAANSESNSEAEKGGVIEKMKEKIESQEKELGILHSQQREITLRMEEMKKQTDEIAMLWEAMHKMQESQASESIPQCDDIESMTIVAAESNDSRLDTDAEKGYNE